MQVYMVKKGRKDYTCHSCGGTIKAGEGYRWWQHMRERMTRRCLRCGMPKASDLATSDKVKRYCLVNEQVEDAMSAVDSAGSDGVGDAVTELIEIIRNGAEELRTLSDEYNESADNMEAVFPNGSTQIDDIRQKADTLSSWADNMEAAADELESIDLDTDCEECGGSGEVECTNCDGEGTLNPTPESLDAGEPNECEDCEGTGKVSCDACGGYGEDIQRIVDEAQSAVDDALSETL